MKTAFMKQVTWTVLLLAGLGGWMIPVSAHGEAVPSPTLKSIVREIEEWDAATDPSSRDKLQEDLDGKVKKVDCAQLVQALPAPLLMSPWGLQALAQWAATHRTNAVTWMAQQKNPTSAQMAAVSGGWLVQNAGEMHRYLETLPAGPWRETLLAAVVQDAIGTSHLPEALSLLKQMAPGETQNRMRDWMATRWGQTDLKGATDWVGTLADPELKKRMICRVAVGRASFDPEEGAQWVMESLPEGEDRDKCLADIIQMWVIDSEPESAAEWIGHLPKGATRRNALAQLVTGWREKSLRGVSPWSWIQKLPTGPVQQEAVALLNKKAS